MERERRSWSAESRQAHAQVWRSVSSDLGHLGRRIGPAWLTVSQLCLRWQVDRKTIYKFIDANVLPAWKVGSHLYRVGVEEVLRFEARNKVPAIRPERRASPTPED
jgi:excisionase family DNA binding protein